MTTFVGSTTSDTINGASGNDVIDAGAGNDKLIGGAGSDIMLGGDGSDMLVGGADNDVMDGGADADRVSGDAGNDTALYVGAANDAGVWDIYDGGSGKDTLRIVMTYADWVAVNAKADGTGQTFQAELIEYYKNFIPAHTANGTKDADNAVYSFDTIGLQASKFETADVFILKDGVSYADFSAWMKASGTSTAPITNVATQLNILGNDNATIKAAPGADTEVIEAGGASNTGGDAAAKGKLIVTDFDVGQAEFQAPASLTGKFGSFTFNAKTGEWSYQLDTTKSDSLKDGQKETDTLTVKSADGTASHNIVVTVTGTNDGPVAVADTAAGTENQTLTIDVLANDTDVDAGAVRSIVSASAPDGQGSASVVAGKVVFNPGTDFDGLAQGATQSVTLAYTMTDEHGAESSSTVVVTVTGTNDGPVAVADTAAGTENQTLTIDVLANDTDVDAGAVRSIVSASAPDGQGSASVVAGKVVFNPGTDFDGLAQGATQSVTLAYTMTDEHGAESSSTVVVTVTGTNDGPVAVADTAAGTENQTLTIDVLANDTDVDAGAVRSIVSASAPDGQGSASVVAGKVVFNPGTDFDGLAQGATQSVTLAYTMTDEHGAESSSTVVVTVTGTNDGPVAVADTAAGTENQTLTIDVLANDTDVDAGAVRSIVSASAPDGQGSASVVAGKVVFNPGTDFDGLAQGATQSVTLAYTMTDEHGAESSSTVVVTVTGTNDGPVAVADTAAGTENQTLTIDVLANDTDVDAGAVRSIVSASAPDGQGSASVVAGKVVFNPGTDFDGLAQGATQSVTLAYTMTDEHGAESSSTVVVTVTGTNDGPVAVADTAAGTENQTLTIDVLANDTDVDAGAVRSIVSASAPDGQGSASVVAGKVVFNPGTDFDGLAQGATQSVTLAYTMTDEHGAESSSTVVVTVTGTNDGPVAVADTAAGTENQTLTIDVLANDTDVDAGAVRSIVSASAPDGQGSASVVAGKVVFNPGTDFDGLAQGATQSVTLAYTMTDEHGAESSSTVVVTVTGTNDGPKAVALTGSPVGENAASVVIGTLSTSDVDDGDTFTYSVTDSRFVVSGTTLKLADGFSFDFEDPSLTVENGKKYASVAVTATDAGNLTKTETFKVEVTNVNEAPTSVSLAGSPVAENFKGATVGTLSAGDPENNVTTYSVTDSRFVVSGTTLKLADGFSFDFEDPSLTVENGKKYASVAVTATDAGNLTKTETFKVEVTNVNETPTYSSFVSDPVKFTQTIAGQTFDFSSFARTVTDATKGKLVIVADGDYSTNNGSGNDNSGQNSYTAEVLLVRASTGETFAELGAYSGTVLQGSGDDLRWTKEIALTETQLDAVLRGELRIKLSDQVNSGIDSQDYVQATLMYDWYV